MPLSPDSAKTAAAEMLSWRLDDQERLDRIHLYLRGKQPHPSLPSGAPDQLTRLAKMSRVNMMKIVVSATAQALYVDGFRQRLASEDAPVWTQWQDNRMDRGQIAVHRAALTYGHAYALVLRGAEQDAVIKCFSPRSMTALYGDDPDWPQLALRAEPSADKWLYRLYDEEAVYFLEGSTDASSKESTLEHISTDEHGMGITPVVRFLNEEDLDHDNEGEIEGLFDLQDQVDATTLGLLVAQHFAAFRQRYVIGWTAESEAQLVKASAARLWTFQDGADEVKVGEFSQTELGDYLKSREESLKELASISQTPVHELIGSLVNLSAEALVAAEAGQRRKIVERQTGFGESWGMVMQLAAEATGDAIDIGAAVRWRDTESRALAATVDALGKMATMLGIPPEELWDRVPNVTQDDINRWKAKVAEGGPIAKLADQLAKAQSSGSGDIAA